MIVVKTALTRKLLIPYLSNAIIKTPDVKSNKIKFIYTPHNVISKRFRGVYSVKKTIFVKINFRKIQV